MSKFASKLNSEIYLNEKEIESENKKLQVKYRINIWDYCMSYFRIFKCF